jgi:myo-inositol-1(or 4)-monophosphatase
MSAQINKLIKAAKKGGLIVKKYFNRVSTFKTKSTLADIRTIADLESEKALLKILSREFPKCTILSEEKGEINKKSENVLIVDPLDGTNNFMLGIPYFSISIALLKNSKLMCGVVYNPILDQLYFAERGKGAFCGNKKLRVNKETKIKNATIAYTCGYLHSGRNTAIFLENLYKLGVKRVLINWSPALDFCLLALGKIEAVINNNNEIYDFCAGKLIAKEAGAVITDFEGKKEIDEGNSTFIASNGKRLHYLLLKNLNFNIYNDYRTPAKI